MKWGQRKLNSKEREVALLYSMTGYTGVNEALRKGVYNWMDKGQSKEMIKALDKIINKSTLDEDTTLYRGMFNKGMAKNPERFVGAVIKDKGYSSFTPVSGIAEGFTIKSGYDQTNPRNTGGAVVFRLDAPAGSKALKMVKGITHYPAEKEVILPRGQSYKIVGVREKSKGRVVFDVQVR